MFLVRLLRLMHACGLVLLGGEWCLDVRRGCVVQT